MSKGDFLRFASMRFLRTVDAELLHAFFVRYAIAAEQLDLGLLRTVPEDGRASVITYLLHTQKLQIPETLIEDLHRIDRLGTPLGQDIILEAAKRCGRQIVPEDQMATTAPRNLALRAFIENHDIFTDAENGLALMPPLSVSHFNALDDGASIDDSDHALRNLTARAREIFKADLRDQFCEVIPYQDGGEANILIRYGDHLTVTEVVEEQQKRVRSFRELATAVLAYSPEEGRLKIWGCAKATRVELAKAYADAVLHRPGLFNAPTSRRICTLERVEEAGSSFSFRCRHDTDIDKVLIYEAQANRMVTGPRGAQRVGLSLLARDPAGDALRALHESRRDIAYGDGGWILAHLVIKVVLRSDRARPLRANTDETSTPRKFTLEGDR